MIAHALAFGGGVAFIPFTYVTVVSPMAQFFPRSLLRWIEGEWIRYRGFEFGFGYVPAISDSLQSFKKEGAGDRHSRIVTYTSNVRNWAKAARRLSRALSAIRLRTPSGLDRGANGAGS